MYIPISNSFHGPVLSSLVSVMTFSPPVTCSLSDRRNPFSFERIYMTCSDPSVRIDNNSSENLLFMRGCGDTHVFLLLCPSIICWRRIICKSATPLSTTPLGSRQLRAVPRHVVPFQMGYNARHVDERGLAAKKDDRHQRDRQ